MDPGQRGRVNPWSGSMAPPAELPDGSETLDVVLTGPDPPPFAVASRREPPTGPRRRFGTMRGLSWSLMIRPKSPSRVFDGSTRVAQLGRTVKAPMHDQLEGDMPYSQGSLAQCQPPTLSLSEERRLRAGLAWRHNFEWLMAAAAVQLQTSLEEILSRPAWQDDAAYRGSGAVESFMPGRGGSFHRARELCAGCLVRQECLDFALADEEIVGVWGGTTERERIELRRRRRSVA